MLCGTQTLQQRGLASSSPRSRICLLKASFLSLTWNRTIGSFGKTMASVSWSGKLKAMQTSDSHTAHPIPSTSSQAISRRRYIPYLVFTLCASLYFLPFMRLLMRGTDEGFLLDGAVRIAHGQIFARDFFEVVGPGTFYWLAFFFKLFGVKFLATRISLFLTSLGTALLMYFLARRVCPRYPVLPCILAFSTYFGMLWPAISHHTDSNFFALLAFTCMVL